MEAECKSAVKQVNQPRLRVRMLYRLVYACVVKGKEGLMLISTACIGVVERNSLGFSAKVIISRMLECSSLRLR